MKGGIYTSEKCFVCGKNLKHDERRNGLFCPDHPQVSAQKVFLVRFGRKIKKQFSSYDIAAQFLNGLRFKTVEGSFDARDYQADLPLSFINLSEKYLKRKAHLKSFKECKRHIKTAQEYFIHRNVKEITGADIEDYLFSIPGISEKTRANYSSRLSDFWKWILRRQVITLAQMPVFPNIQYELGYRKITDMDTQGTIINKVRELSEHINPKIWAGIDLLATYVNLRPGDLLKLRECDIELRDGTGHMIFHYPTKRKNKMKITRLLEHHIEMLAGLKEQFPAMPDMPFFRHNAGINRVQQGQPFGPKYFKVWWDRACKELGIVGLDLYGGTRHSTVTAIARKAGTENARKASSHETNAAFDRYCQYQDDTAFEMARIMNKAREKSGGQIVTMDKKRGVQS